ncbi:post-GPI attachment to proteins factor 2-like isoform X2 [Gouania willdenowi]|uniref:Acyltransferase PGAP2 n=1 Tax=Gouania willdenowi TaxID=441366 RepID=A0A8C5EFP9_GOUWI|nr:post-GPI attachment to proteins factor 2-like isoform X2 [Gouania willdenowi]
MISVYPGGERPFVHLSFISMLIPTLLLPLVGLIVCLFISICFHFKESTYTHCQVANALPSISAAISLTPQRYIWRGCVGLHSAPRFLFSFMYFSLYQRRLQGALLRLLGLMVLLCSLMENSGLLLLTYVASTENYELHKKGFIVFVLTSALYMLLTVGLCYIIQRKYVSLTGHELKSYRWKLRLFLFNISCCLAAAYFFRRHNQHCEPQVYSLFALFEYLVVLSNMAFHSTSCWDFTNTHLLVATPPEAKQY